MKDKDLNIATILKDKPKGSIKLWSPMIGECELRHINDDIDDSVSVVSTYSLNSYGFIKDGRFSEKGEICLFPSKQMRDWNKFAWKRGDVLVSDKGEHCFFYGWSTGDYEKFEGRYSSSDNYSEKSSINTFTYKWEKETKDFVINKYIKEVESKNNAKLNPKTLEFETKKPEFKDKDIVFMREVKSEFSANCIFILRGEYNSGEKEALYYVFYNADNKFVCAEYGKTRVHYSLRPATDQEKQQLFGALAKKGKRWNPETKQLEDLPKKREFEPMDYVLVKSKKDNYAIWNLYQFAYKGINMFYMVGNISFIIADNNFLPYNDQTKHLLGTPDEWKGGAE